MTPALSAAADLSPKALARLVPAYKGRKWITVRLPSTVEYWSAGGRKSVCIEPPAQGRLVAALKDLKKRGAWRWPKRRHFFMSDLHGDPEAFSASLVASGGVRRTGPAPRDFTLTSTGRMANFVIGGDCFDKGPCSLDLLRTIRHLMRQGARVRILAGNHDIRVLLGMLAVGHRKDVANEHFFVRTGKKIIPLLKEVLAERPLSAKEPKALPGEKKCRQQLYPRKSWARRFANLEVPHLTAEKRVREIERIEKKRDAFASAIEEAGLSHRDVLAAVRRWRQLFLSPEGEFYWFFKDLRLCYRSGSLLFVHAGLDDEMASRLAEEGVGQMNRAFRAALKRQPPGFYYGPLCNTIRTKYRPVDAPLTRTGIDRIRRAGITALIHGHQNLHNGQRLNLRRSLLNFECDTSLDRHTRKVEKVRGRGASVTIIDGKGYILGVSSDYPHIKFFEPNHMLRQASAAKRKSAGPRRRRSAKKRPIR